MQFPAVGKVDTFWKERSRPRSILLPTVMVLRVGRRRRRGSGGTASRIPMLHALPIVWNCLSKRRSSLLATRQVVRRRSRTLLVSMLSLLWVLSDSTAYLTLESTVAADGILNVSYSKSTPEWQDYVPLNKIIAIWPFPTVFAKWSVDRSRRIVCSQTFSREFVFPKIHPITLFYGFPCISMPQTL